MLSYGYGPSGRIRTLSWDAGAKADSATYEYVENSHLLFSMKTGTGLTTSYTYEDHRNVKTAVSNSFGNTAVSTYTYEYDELGRRKSVKNSGSAFTNPNFNIYGYNDRSEVTAANSFTGEDLANKNNPLADRGRAYNYDPIGNRKTASEAANNFAYSANSLNQYESISGGANPETPAYDADGNMTVAQGMVYSFNAENRLIEAAPQNPQQGSVKSTYIYDYMGRRAQKTLYTYSSGSWQKQKDISFIYDGWNMVKETVKSSDSSPEVPVYYVWGLDLSQSMQGAGGVGGLIASVRAGNEYLYSFDANGNVGQMVKSSDGSIAARYEYDPFGKTILAEGQMAGENSYRFSTKYMDGETGFYYYGYRYYDIEIGRWINRDPVGEAAGISINSFLDNDSLNLVDLYGLTLFAFDGTGDNKYYGQYTHVGRLYELYGGHKHYYHGVGSLLNGYGLDFIQGMSGAGAISRVESALEELDKELKSTYEEDRIVDIIGFSRGAAISRLFAKRVFEKYGDCVQIRFVGLFDTVASFNGVNEELNGRNALNLPKTVKYAMHLAAADEQRSLFPVTMLNMFDSPGTWKQEIWSGAHADIGGGYGDKNNQLAYDSLARMHYYAVDTAGVPFNSLDVTRNDFQDNYDPHTPHRQVYPVPYILTENMKRKFTFPREGVIEPSIPGWRKMSPQEMKGIHYDHTTVAKY